MTPTSLPLRVLFAEDSGDDVELELIALRQGGFAPSHHVVQDETAFRAALDRGGWDIVIADYCMPTFDGVEALAIARSMDEDIPFILVSGTVGEDVAVHAMRAGAHDYVLKENLTRLAPAVARELREAALRREKRRVERSQRFLAEASATLAESLDYQETLARVAALAVPAIGDWCVVDLVDEDGAIQRVAVAHRDPARKAIAFELQGFSSSVEATRGVGAVIRTGAAELVPEVTPEVITQMMPDPERRRVVEALGLASYMIVPLTARGHTLGSLTFVSIDPRRAFGSTDLDVAQELGRRAAVAVDNARLYQRAQDAVRLRDDFLSIASHELKTPLTAVQLQIQGLADLVARLPGETTDPRLQPRLQRAVQATDRLVRLVESLLDVSRISTGRMRLRLEPFDLDGVVREVCERLQEKARGVGSELRIARCEPIAGTWDRLRMEQVVTNLLTNAIKYGGGNPIDVSVTRTGERATIRVIDGGIGFPAADRERIFGRFERAVSSRHYGGLGLGLFITRQIVGAHGGTIAATPTPGGGATFLVELPLVTPTPDDSGVL